MLIDSLFCTKNASPVIIRKKERRMWEKTITLHENKIGLDLGQFCIDSSLRWYDRIIHSEMHWGWPSGNNFCCSVKFSISSNADHSLKSSTHQLPNRGSLLHSIVSEFKNQAGGSLCDDLFLWLGCILWAWAIGPGSWRAENVLEWVEQRDLVVELFEPSSVHHALRNHPSSFWKVSEWLSVTWS